MHNGAPLLLSEGLICPYEMYYGNGTSLTPFSTPIGTNTIGNCRQQCDNLQICQAYTFAEGTCKLYQTAPTDPTITAAARSTLNIKKCINPDGRVIIVHLKYKLLQPIKLDTCKHEKQCMNCILMKFENYAATSLVLLYQNLTYIILNCWTELRRTLLWSRESKISF